MNVPGRKKKTSFLDLPTEIRCHVYSYLALKGKFTVYLRRHPDRLHPRGQKRTIINPKYEPELDARILFVNKLIYNEAIPILYSDNSFTATDPALMTAFIQSIGRSIEHLTQIGIEYTSLLDFRTDFRKMIGVLTGAKNLKVLELSQMIYDRGGTACSLLLTSVADVLRETMPLLKALDRARPKETGVTRLASQLLSVRITPPPEDGFWERLYADVDHLEEALKMLMENTFVS